MANDRRRQDELYCRALCHRFTMQFRYSRSQYIRRSTLRCGSNSLGLLFSHSQSAVSRCCARSVPPPRLICKFVPLQSQTMPAAMFPWYHAGSTNNPEKNRHKEFVCFDETRPSLVDGFGHKYINASEVHLPGDNLRYILTQSPLKNTLVDFWRLMWQEKPLMMVALCQPLRDEERYLPPIGVNYSYGRFDVIRDVEQDSNEWWTTMECTVSLMKRPEDEEDEEPATVDSVTLRCMMWYEWSQDADIPSPERMLSFVQELHLQTDQEMDNEERSRISRADILFMCSSGSIRSGLVAASSALIGAVSDEAFNFDQVNRVVRKLRESRHGTIGRLSQYAYLHWLVLETIKETPDLTIPGGAHKRLAKAIDNARSVFESANRQEKLAALQ